jgi:hypothetical protein
MVPFLVFLVLLVALAVGYVWINLRLYRRNWTLQERQLVTLRHEAFLERRSSRLRGSRFSIGMGDCVWRVFCIVMTTLGVIIILVVAFISFAS